MSVRKELIILEMEDNASREALQAAAAFKTLDTALGSMDGHATTVSRRFTSMTQRADKLAGSMGKANTALGQTDARLASLGSVGLVRFSQQTDKASASIDRFSGRAALLGTAITAIGPAAIPIAAAAVPAISALAAGMGAAAGAAGVLALAFSGVGDAVSAVSDYRLAPTAENLAKVQQAMEELGPAGAQFVMTLDRISPALEDLQQRAGAGIFPGFERGLNQLMTELPGVRNLVSDLSLTVGTLGEASANALTNDADWQEFFAHIANDGAPALESFGRATGNFTAGVANVLEALTGIGGGSASLVETSRAFREWADNLEHTQGFQEFADYVRESGPQVAEFLAATGNAMLGLAEAAAPWGQVVLPALTAFADIVGVIGGSPLGPPLFAAAAAMLAFNKASALMGPNLDRAKSSLSGLGTSLRQTGADLMTMSGGWSSASKSTARDAAAMTAATGRLKGNLASIGEHARTAGPGLAAFGFMASGAADSMGLSNTALLTMAGAMAGPWGAAAGAAIGLAIDFAKANDEVEKSVSDASSAVASADFAEIGNQFRTANESLKEFKKDAESFEEIDWDFGDLTDIRSLKNSIEGIFGKSDLEELQERMAKTRTEFSNLVDAGSKLGEAFDIDVGGTQAQKLTALQELATAAQPAMSALGITFEDLGNAAGRSDGSLDVMVGKITEWQAVADSAAGRTAAYGDALRKMGQDALGAAESASELSARLAAILDPAQGLIAAEDAMASSLSGLKGQIDGTNQSLNGNSDAAIKNRAAISSGVDAIQNLHGAQADAQVSLIEMAQTMGSNRQALIDQGVAAGMSRRQVEALVNQMGLTPEVVRTAFEAAGIENIDAKTIRLTNRYNALPKNLRTHIATNGIPKSEADITRLKKKYDLTPPEVRTLASLMDNASPKIRAVIAALRAADGQSATTTITTVMRTVEQTAAINRERANGGFQQNGRLAFADGGYGMDGRYYTRQPQIIPGGANILWGEKETGWEAYISGKPSEKQRNLDILAMAADRLGAQVTPFANGGTRGNAGPRRSWEDGPVYTALWQSGRRDPSASLIANMTGKQLARLGKAFDDISSKRLTRFGRSIERATDVQNKQLDSAKEQLAFWKNKKAELQTAVTGSMTLDWFGGGSTDPWSGATQPGTAAYANQQWAKQAGDSDKLTKTIANLKKNGASDAFIAEILRSPDPLAAATMFNQQSKGDMRRSQNLYLEATKATASTASYTSGVVYGDEIAAANKRIDNVRGDLKDIQALLKKHHREAQENRDKNSPRKAAAKGARSRK